jgi:hypothetical protein
VLPRPVKPGTTPTHQNSSSPARQGAAQSRPQSQPLPSEIQPLPSEIGKYGGTVVVPVKRNLPHRTTDVSASRRLPSKNFEYPRSFAYAEFKAKPRKGSIAINNQIHKDSDLSQNFYIGNQSYVNNTSDQIGKDGKVVVQNGALYGGFQTGADAVPASRDPKRRALIYSLWGATDSKIGRGFEEIGVAQGLDNDRSGEGSFRQIIVPFDFKKDVNYKLEFVPETKDWIGMYITDPSVGKRMHVGSHKYANHGGLQGHTTTFLETFGGTGDVDKLNYFGVLASSDYGNRTAAFEAPGDLNLGALGRATPLGNEGAFLEAGIHQPTRSDRD